MTAQTQDTRNIMAKSAYEQRKELEEILKKEFMEEYAQNAETVGSKEGTRVQGGELDFDIKPEELESYLNRYEIGRAHV